MSQWASGGDPAEWQYQAQAATRGPQSTTQPSSINPQFEQWNPQPEYGQPQGNSNICSQTDYGIQSVAGGGQYQQLGQNQANSFASTSSQSHHPQNPPYPPSGYPNPHQQTYQSVSNPPAQPQPSPHSYLDPSTSYSSFRYGPPPSELPVPLQTGTHLSATAQRFQNAAPSPTYDSSLVTPSQQPTQSQRNYTSSPRPTPTPASIQQYHRKVDELAMLEHRLAQLQSILSRGTMAEAGRPGSSQPILANQRAHLEIQLKEFKNRQLNLLNECDAFTRHFGPASSWETSFMNPNGSVASSGLSGPTQRARTVSAGLQPPHQSSTPPNRQYTYDGQMNAAGQPPYPQTVQQPHPYSNSHDRQLSSNSFDSSYSSSNGSQPIQQTGYNEMMRGSTPVQNQITPSPHQQNPYHAPPYASHHQQYHSSPHPGPSPSYSHFPNTSLPPDRHQSPSQQQRQSLPPSQPVVSSNPLPPNPPNYSSYSSPSQPTQQVQNNGQPYPYQQLASAARPLQPFPQQPPNRPNPTSAPVPPPPPQQQLPPGLQAQVDALSREQAANNARSRNTTNPNGIDPQNPLQVLIKKAENGEMPVMTMSGLRKQSDVERERKEEEEREKARLANNESNGNGANGNGNQKLPTTILAELTRSGGGPTLAEMVMTIDQQVFWNQLQQSCAKRNINVVEEVHQGSFVVEGKPIDLLQLFQTVVSRGGGYGKIDAGNAWPHVATLLAISTRSAIAQTRIKEIYHRILAPFEDLWATQMTKLREKQRAMDEARRVLGAMPAAASSLTASPNQPNPHQSSPAPPHPQSVPSPLTTKSHLVPPNASARRSPSQPQSTISPAPGGSSMFANPISYNSLPPSSPYAGGSASQPLPPQPAAPVEKTVTSADLLEQARALRRNAAATTNGTGGGGQTSTESTSQQQPPSTSPPQETSSTPQESTTTSIPAPAPVVEAPSKPSPSSIPKSIPSSQNSLQSTVAAAGHVAPFSTSMAQLGIGVPASSTITEKNGTNPKKRKNDESDGPDEGAKTRNGRTRNRSTSNLEAPVVGQQTNEPHFNPFEINHFLPFTTAPPSILPSPTSVAPFQSLVSEASSSAKSTTSNLSLRPDASSTSGETTISPQSISDKAALSSPGTINGGVNGFTSGNKAVTNFGNSPLSAGLDPSALDSISLSMSLDPLASSRPTTSWSTQDSAVANGMSAFETFPGIDNYPFTSTIFDDPAHGLDAQSLIDAAGPSGSGIPNWSPGGLDGAFDFSNTFS